MTLSPCSEFPLHWCSRSNFTPGSFSLKRPIIPIWVYPFLHGPKHFFVVLSQMPLVSAGLHWQSLIQSFPGPRDLEDALHLPSMQRPQPLYKLSGQSAYVVHSPVVVVMGFNPAPSIFAVTPSVCPRSALMTISWRSVDTIWAKTTSVRRISSISVKVGCLRFTINYSSYKYISFHYSKTQNGTR